MKIRDLIQSLQENYVNKLDSLQSKEEAVALLKDLFLTLKGILREYQIVKRPPRKTGKSRIV